VLGRSEVILAGVSVVFIVIAWITVEIADPVRLIEVSPRFWVDVICMLQQEDIFEETTSGMRKDEKALSRHSRLEP
jgi:hypothetical protein